MTAEPKTNPTRRPHNLKGGRPVGSTRGKGFRRGISFKASELAPFAVWYVLETGLEPEGEIYEKWVVAKTKAAGIALAELAADKPARYIL